MDLSDPNEALLREGAWLRRLAFELVPDPGCAEDAAQEAWIRAAGHGATRSRQGFLVSILRNFVRQEQRSEARRRGREHLAHEARTEPSSLDVVAKLDLQRSLVDALQELSEPYRETLVLRYLEDVPPREVARRMGVPPRTVHTRLARGLTQMRELLDRRSGGDRSRWLGACVAVLGDRGTWTGGIAVGAKLKLAGIGAGIAALGAAVVLSRGGEPESGPRSAEAPAERQALAAREAPAIVVDGGGTEQRLPVTAPVPAGAPPPRSEGEEPLTTPPTEGLRTLSGFARDVDGYPVEGARVVLELDLGGEATGGEPATTQADGTFELGVPRASSGYLVAGRDDLTTLVKARVQGGDASSGHVIVLAARRSYSGRVVDPAGLPIARARIDVRLAGVAVERIRFGTEQTIVPLLSVRSDGKGQFRLEDVGYVDGLFLVVEHDGYESLLFDLPPGGGDLELELRPRELGPRTLVGEVVLESGAPVADARVSAGTFSVVSDRDGRFVLELEGETRPTRVRAVVQGRLPGSSELVWTPSGPAPVRLVLGTEPLAIAGRVLDAEGRPLEGALVRAEEGTHFGMIPFPAERLGSFSVRGDVEDLIAGGELGAGLRATADSTGGFELPSLLDAEYDLLVLHPGTLERTGPLPVRAGTRDVELRLPPAPTRRVAGRLLSLDGTPLSDQRIVARARWSRGGGPLRREATTADDGSFELGELTTRNLELVVHPNEGTLFHQLAVEDGADASDLVFRIPAPCRLRVTLETFQADAVSLLDAEGESLSISFAMGPGSVSSDEVELAAGRTGTMTVSETARTLVFLKDGEEVSRQAVHLVPGEVVELRF